MKTINEMTQAEFRALPYRSEGQVTGHSLIILPSRRLHDSGYRLLDFVLVSRKDKALCRVSGCSDVLHIDGIGGIGKDWLKRYGTCPNLVPPTGWSIDCLAKSGLLRLFPSQDRYKGITVDAMALSSFEVFAEPK